MLVLILGLPIVLVVGVVALGGIVVNELMK